jgi:RNA polymerase sigma factor (TIGR02999 family)
MQEGNPTQGEMTNLLNEAEAGGEQAARILWSQIYDRLIAIARKVGGRDIIPIRPSDLAHDAYLKVARGRPWSSRQHFFRAFAQAARQCRIDRWRKDRGRLALIGEPAALAFRAGELRDVGLVSSEAGRALLSALARLEELDPDQAEAVRLLYIVGMETAEVARVLDVSTKTVKRRWTAATAHLKVMIEEYLDDAQH